MLLTVVLFRTCRTLNKLPLYGIDWLGGLLWGLILLSVIFICIYGEHYDWYASPYIRMATIAAIVMILLNVWRSSFIRHPFIAPETWLFKSVYMTFLLYIVIDLLLAPSHLFEHLYMEAILGYDALNTASLNWVVLSGVITGSLFTYQTFALRKWCYRTMTVIAFSAIVGYLTLFYFTIDYHLSKEFLIFPIFLRGFGYVIIAICFLTALSRVPFSEFLPVGIRTSLRQCRIRKCTRHRRPGTDARTDCKKERFTTRSKPGSCQPADRTDSLERTLRNPPTTGPDRLPQRTIRLAGIRRHPLSSVVYNKRKQYPSPSRHTPHLSGYPEIDPGGIVTLIFLQTE